MIFSKNHNLWRGTDLEQDRLPKDNAEKYLDNFFHNTNRSFRASSIIATGSFIALLIYFVSTAFTFKETMKPQLKLAGDNISSSESLR